MFYLLPNIQADNKTIWFINRFGDPECFTHSSEKSVSCKNIFEVKDLLEYYNQSVENNKSEMMLQIPGNCTKELRDLSSNDFICELEEAKIEKSEEEAFEARVSKCCNMSEIFNAKSNSCENGNFSTDELTFYELKKTSSGNNLVEVIDQNDLETIGFTHGLLQDADCSGGGRK